MTVHVSVALRNALLQGSSVKEELDGGFLYLFSGTVPATADTALDMVTVHTQLAKIAADDPPVAAGVTGLTFEAAAVNGALPKETTETWAAVIDFVGADAADAGVSPLTASFFRFCGPGDNGQAAGDASTTPRIQGSLATAGGDINLVSTSLDDNGTNTVGVSVFEVRQPAS